MLRTVSIWRHGVAVLAVLFVVGLAGCGAIGAGDQSVLREEHFDRKVVTVVPAGSGAVRIREVVDMDFGLEQRHGYQRIIPNDFGVPTDVSSSSPDADASLDVLQVGDSTRLRIGDPFTTVSGQHRYVLEYTLPDARLSGGELALDIIGAGEELITDRFEVVLDGFVLSDPSCDVGSAGMFGGCRLEQVDNDTWTTTFEPLNAGEGVTVGGQIDAITPAEFGAPGPLPERNPSGLRPLGWALLPCGLIVVVAVYLVSRRLGSNFVRAGGAADAAYGDLPTPRSGDRIADVPTYRVPDSRLAELATIEFVPPRGLEPWQAAALISERVDDDTVTAWFSEMIADGAIVVDDEDADVLRRGANTTRLSAVDRAHLERLFADGDSIQLGTYDSGFTSTWQAIRSEQKRFVAQSGWWVHGAPGGSFDTRQLTRILIPLLFVVVISGTSILIAGRTVADAVGSVAAAVAFSILFVGVVAFFAYRTLLPSRSATGSALTLRSESFRRFLAASEGRHVEWAWENNLLREYSAWAVALGAADAWTRAVQSSNIPHPELALRGPLLMYTAAASLQSARTAPSTSSGGGGGGGFGGGVGGGGGGGSSGSW